MALTSVNSIQLALQQLNLPYVIQEHVQGDGNCFFRAVLQHLRQELPCQFTDHLHLRHKLVNFVQTNARLQQVEEFCVAKANYIANRKDENESSDHAWRRLCNKMRENGVWAEDLFILCMSVFLRREIRITSVQQSKTFP